MTAFLWVGLGGFLGAIARYAAALALAAPTPGRFPTATFLVNCVGCLLIGLVAARIVPLWPDLPVLAPAGRERRS